MTKRESLCKQITTERVVCIDVDETLVSHGRNYPTNDYMSVHDHVIPGNQISVYPMKANIRILKEEHARGSYVIVWSKGGHQWATDVVRALGLTKHVDLILTKPAAYVDDKEVGTWLTDRIYIPSTEPYKE